jgi:hypothetical protein
MTPPKLEPMPHCADPDGWSQAFGVDLRGRPGILEFSIARAISGLDFAARLAQILIVVKLPKSDHL